MFNIKNTNYQSTNMVNAVSTYVISVSTVTESMYVFINFSAAFCTAHCALDLARDHVP